VLTHGPRFHRQGFTDAITEKANAAADPCGRAPRADLRRGSPDTRRRTPRRIQMLLPALARRSDPRPPNVLSVTCNTGPTNFPAEHTSHGRFVRLTLLFDSPWLVEIDCGRWQSEPVALAGEGGRVSPSWLRGIWRDERSSAPPTVGWGVETCCSGQPSEADQPARASGRISGHSPRQGDPVRSKPSARDTHAHGIWEAVRTRGATNSPTKALDHGALRSHDRTQASVSPTRFSRSWREWPNRASEQWLNPLAAVRLEAGRRTVTVNRTCCA